MTTSHIGFRER